MKTAATKVSDQEYEFLQRYAKSQGSNVNTILGNLVRGLTDGKVKPTFTKDSSPAIQGKIPYKDLRKSLLNQCVKILKILIEEE